MNKKYKKAQRIHAGWTRAISDPARSRHCKLVGGVPVGPRRGKLVRALVGSSVSGGDQRSGRTLASRAISAASLRSRAEEDIPGKNRRRRRRRGNDALSKKERSFFFQSRG